MSKCKQALLFLPSAIWYGLIWNMSAQPATLSSSTSSSTIGILLTLLGTDFLQMQTEVQTAAVELLSFYVRKGAHMFLFFVLSLFLWYGFSSLIKNCTRRTFCTAFFCTVLASLDEYHQTFIPGRSGEVRDVLVDLTGAVIALLLFSLPTISLWIRKKLSHPERLWWVGALCGAVLLIDTGLLTSLPPVFVPRISDSPVLSSMTAGDRAEILRLTSPVLRQTLYLFISAAFAFLSTLLAILSGNRRAVVLALSTVCGFSFAAGIFWSLPLAPAIILCLVGGSIALVLKMLFPLLRQ